MTLLTHCPFCRGTAFEPHSTARYWTVVPLRFVACSACGLVFSNPMPGMDIVAEGNRALSILQPTRGTFSQYRGGREYSLSLRRFRRAGTLLDIGSAQGFFLKGVEENSSWRAEGLEIIDSAVAFARERLGLTVHHGTLETLPGGEARYDMLRMNNVIEHVQDPHSFLRAAYALLQPGGRVYCSTPNGIQDGAILRVANSRGFEMNLLENHFYLYRPRTLRAMFEACGFHVLRHHLEDVSHTLHDFGITPGIRPPAFPEQHNLAYYRELVVPDFAISDEEIQSYRGRRSAAVWRIRLDRAVNGLGRLRLPVRARIGHQQYLHAEKPAMPG